MGDYDDEKEIEKRIMPRSELDFNMMTTESVWGKPQINKDLKARLSQYIQVVQEDGKAVINTRELWGLLGYYTRDLRLANLSTARGEMFYAQYYLDLAGDMLQASMVEPFLICLSRVATLVELSQSKGGFLRKRMNTFTAEHYRNDLEPKKKSLMGKKQSED